MRDIIPSAILRLSYDAFSRELDILFASGRHRRYFNVPAIAYRHFVDADDKTGFFVLWMRGRYRYEEITFRSRWQQPQPYRHRA